MADASLFELLVSNPTEWDHAGLAAAAAKAGETGIIDAFFARNAALIRRHRKSFERAAPDGVAPGLRIQSGNLKWLDELAGEGTGFEILILALTDESTVPGKNELLKYASRIFLEIPSGRAMGQFTATDCDGLVLSGNEAAGFAGSLSSFLAAQTAASTDMPVYIRGGIGMDAVAACKVAGCSGVMIEEAAWLFPESPLPGEWRSLAPHLTGEETRYLDERQLMRGYAQPIFREKDSLGEFSWPEALERMGWDDSHRQVVPWGQAIGLAQSTAGKFANLSHLLRGCRETLVRNPSIAASNRPLDSDGKFARNHGLKAAVVQGPMTRVSDTPSFASSVGKSGAMPTLALALMDGARSETLLEETSSKMGGSPWGVGILGFVPRELQDEQIQAVLRAKPSFAVIAGGQPDQAEVLEEAGISTFLHVPSPKLLSIFLRQGAKRFIFEGRECGGHVGPLGSLVLWQSMMETLLSEAQSLESVEVLFAGGIHDALSSAMACVCAAPLIDRGGAFGILVGTPYLFTKEIVEDKAITPLFQQEALQCRDTVCLPVATGHANRCVNTQFAQDYMARRTELLAQKTPPDKIREELEAMTLGRLRIATKGVTRDGEGNLMEIPVEEQRAQGMFMIGETAIFHDRVTDLDKLHESLAVKSHELLADESERLEITGDAGETYEKPVDIAVVGISSFLPDAANHDELWRNLLDRHCAVREIPRERWDTRLHYDPDPDAPGKSVSKWGGFFPDIPVDLARLGIPPSSARHMSTSNLLCLEAARLALRDAGYEKRPFDRENTAVILANADGGGHLGHALIVRSLLGLFDPDVDEEVFKRMPPIKDESLPGTLTNVVAGRISNRLDLGGPNYTVDAACASSLATLDLAARELNSGRSNVVLAGASEIVMGPPAYVAFSKVGALSRTGKVKPFDKSADGIALSDGVVFLVLKRLADAEKDGDRIYSVIRGVGGSSDGKALGMTAPRPLGQRRALRRAYGNAGFSPSTIGYYEGHATGTPVGDSAELNTINETLGDALAEGNSCVIGSSKGMLGHSRTSAGMAALTKAILALHYKVLPPLPAVSDPLDGIDEDATPINIRRTPHPWIRPLSTPRRAGVSAFGFGGTNFHAVLEEYEKEPAPRPSGADSWPVEMIFLTGRNDAELQSNAARWLKVIEAEPDVNLRDIAYTSALEGTQDGMALIVGSVGEFSEALKEISGKGLSASHTGITAIRMEAKPVGQLAFLFPGQASQAIDMAGECALYLEGMRESLQDAEEIAAAEGLHNLCRKIYSPAAFSPERLRQRRNELARTEIAQPAIGAVSLGFLAILRQLGLRPDYTLGHSFGEIPALCAAGVFGAGEALRLAVTRGAAMAGAPSGTMAAVHSEPWEIEEILKGYPELVIANHNAPRQVVVSGPVEPLEALVESLNGRGIRSSLLPVSGAFHSPLMEDPRRIWSKKVDVADWSEPDAPVLSPLTGEFHPADPAGIRDNLLSQLNGPVHFVDSIEKLYAEGVRTFVEVGPRSVLSSLLGQILKGRDHKAVVLDAEGKGLAGFLEAIALLWSDGFPVKPAQLFEGRRVNRIPVEKLAAQPVFKHSPTTWWINSSFVRQSPEDDGRYGELPLVTKEDQDKAVEQRKTSDIASSHLPPANSPTLGNNAAAAAFTAYQETMREFLRLQETVMAQFSGGRTTGKETLSGSLPSIPCSNPGVPVEAPAPPVENHPNPVDEPGSTTRGENSRPKEEESPNLPQTPEELLSFVTSMVSEKTGYPPEMLGPDQDIEADLGIDSIKRIEIIDALQATGISNADRRTLVRGLGKMKTLREIATALPRVSNEEEQVPGSGALGAANQILDAVPAGCPRFVIESKPSPLTTPLPLPLRGVFLITQDALGVAEELSGILKTAGATPHILGEDVLLSSSELDRELSELRKEHGRIRGLIHLAPLSGRRFPQELDRSLRVDVSCLFRLARFCSSDLQETGHASMGRVLAASSMGGSFGRGDVDAEFSPTSGGGVGFVKTLDLEWPSVISKAVDFDKGNSPSVIAGWIRDELLYGTNQTEIGYPNGERSTFVPREAPISGESNFRYGEEDVILATGGARGITAKCLLPLLSKGSRLIILGQSKIDSRRTANFRDCEDIGGIRSRLISEKRPDLIKGGPIAVETEAKAISALLEIERNLESFRQKTGTVDYIPVDLRQSGSLGSVIKQITEKYGRVDHVLHGAGALADGLVETKTDEAFENVLLTKTACLASLSEIAGNLKSLVLFASVSGRFGNFGQSDYAAANEILNRFAWRMSRAHPETRVIAINWGPWGEGGMASEGVLNRLRERGIEPVDPASGIAFIRSELGSSSLTPEVVAGSGPWREENPDWAGAFDVALFSLEASNFVS